MRLNSQVVDRRCWKRVDVEIAAQLAIDAVQQVEVERRRDARASS